MAAEHALLPGWIVVSVLGPVYNAVIGLLVLLFFGRAWWLKTAESRRNSSQEGDLVEGRRTEESAPASSCNLRRPSGQNFAQAWRSLLPAWSFVQVFVCILIAPDSTFGAGRPLTVVGSLAIATFTLSLLISLSSVQIMKQAERIATTSGTTGLDSDAAKPVSDSTKKEEASDEAVPSSRSLPNAVTVALGTLHLQFHITYLDSLRDSLRQQCQKQLAQGRQRKSSELLSAADVLVLLEYRLLRLRNTVLGSSLVFSDIVPLVVCLYLLGMAAVDSSTSFSETYMAKYSLLGVISMWLTIAHLVLVLWTFLSVVPSAAPARRKRTPSKSTKVSKRKPAMVRVYNPIVERASGLEQQDIRAYTASVRMPR
jgi:hypothetical protein